MSGRLATEVAIVGGGLVGCSAALHFAHRKVPCVLLEAGRCGSQASGVNFGGVRRQGRALAELPLAERARRMWSRMDRLVGHDCEFRPTGHLRLARDEREMAELERWAKEAARFGIAVELSGAAALRARWPWLGAGLAGGSFCPDDGQANPRLACPLFRRAAAAAGAEIREGERVHAIERGPRGFVLGTEKGLEIEARVLVNAAGAWGSAIAALLGDELPSEAIAPNMAVSEPLPFRIEPGLGTAGPGVYLRQVPSGSVIFGGGRGVVDLARMRCRPLLESTLATLAQVCAIVPELARALVIRSWAGIEGKTPDDLPVIGASAKVRDLWHAFGFSGHGFMLAPAVGAVIVELVLDGHSPTSLKGLEPVRFAEPVPAPG
ncbi:MAG: FAD-binding oxidoreductase [Geminicoccaceae bacterium]|nr:FAD-binding oxidoreductase [Geminicoccaceae bacterium]MCX7629096.1 FAD-binding oxidoreductase [Geminicoccaceae bacterium]MDW8125806.1 FAD-dependent oxidoreductase [Geminicoccaceae bacterium]MDW8342604.1 FAD-dependent oxidoreductase [Geminicoccaceae bacterium]